MSDVVPSFFPTPHEIAGGIRWVREHPVVATAAAAAATAVSVITFLRSKTLFEDDNELVPSRNERGDGELPEPRERFATWTDHYPPPIQTELNSDSILLHRRSRSLQEVLPSKLRNDAKDAEDVYSITDSEFSAASPHLSRRNSPASSKKLCEDTTTNEESPRGVNVPPTCVEGVCFEPEDDPDSASPQWGWYVSTTPPEEQYY